LIEKGETDVKKKFSVLALTAAFTMMSAITAFAGIWVQDPTRPENQNGISNWWYHNDNGTYPASCWFWIDGNGDGLAECYRFNENGWMYAAAVVDGYTVNGSGAWTENNVVQYRRVDASQNTGSTNTGNSEKKNTWVSDAYGKQYYDSKGELVTGWKKISGKRYYFDDSGYALTGFQGDVEGSGYYFLKDGSLSTKTVYDATDRVYYVIDKEDYYVADVVFAEDWKEYKKDADKDSVEVSKVVSEKEGRSIAEEVDTGSDLTDEEAHKKLIALKKSYPEGKRWTNSNGYSRPGITGYGCAAFAFIAQDTVFGKSAPRNTYDTYTWDELRVGDHIRMYSNNGSEHSVIILSVEDDHITVCEGNYNSSIHWGRVIEEDELESEFIYRETCYE